MCVCVTVRVRMCVCVYSYEQREVSFIGSSLQVLQVNREVGLSRFRHRDRVSISPSMPFPISMLEHRIQGWAMPSG